MTQTYTKYALIASVGFCLGAPVYAQAQTNSVSIYGIVDSYIGHVDGSGVARKVVGDGANAPSRWGFRGREDLGGGQFAYFTLESGFNADNGTATLGGAFGRQAMVGLEGPWGSLELGRHYTAVFHYLLAASTVGMSPQWAPIQLPASTNGFSANAAALGFSTRQSNLVRYQYGKTTKPGVGFELFYGPGEGSAAAGDVKGFGASYRGANWFAGYAVQRTNSGTGVATPFYNQTQVLSGTYSPVKGLKMNLNIVNVSSTSGAGAKASHLIPGVSYQTGNHVFLAEYAQRDLKNSANDARVLTLGYDHLLSKRTTLYVRVLSLTNKGSAANTMAGATVTANSGDDVRGYALGLRHNF
jgi:predicted porin